MRKEDISRGYLKDQQRQHRDALSIQDPPERRAVAVVGSDRRSNIGRAIAIRLKADGFDRVLEPPIDELDVTDPVSIQEAWFRAQEVDTLVLSHGVNEMNWFEDAELIDHVFRTNLIGTAKAAQAFVRATLGNKFHKTIILIGSMAYCNVLNSSAVYCASKAGLAMLARCLAWELAPKGYTVVAVHPSNVEGTPMTEATIMGLMRVRHLTREEAEEYWGAVLPKEDWLQPEDIADLVSYLVKGGAGGYLAGANLELRGGQR